MTPATGPVGLPLPGASMARNEAASPWEKTPATGRVAAWPHRIPAANSYVDYPPYHGLKHVGTSNHIYELVTRVVPKL